MTQANVTRRRLLQISAAVPLAGLSARAAAAAPAAHWQGVALGAPAQIVLAGMTQDEAGPVFAMVRDEIARLEAIFSLYQTGSALSKLNAAGRLTQPPPELLEVLSLSAAVWSASEGAFDPSIQRLWQARAMGVPDPDVQGGFGDLRLAADEIVLRPRTALTLNGIAQGYITDRVAAMLRGQGLRDLVVDAGEQRALGMRPGGGGWRIGIAAPSGAVLAQVSLRDRALATSSPEGTVLPNGQGHIIDPRTGRSTARWGTVSVLHDSAAVADALSTAACCLNAQDTQMMLSHFDGAALAYRG